MKKGSIQLEDITFLNAVYWIAAFQNRKHKLVKLKREIEKSTMLVGDFNTSPSITDRISRHKISKAIEVLNHTIKNPDLICIYRSCYTTTEYILYKHAWNFYQDRPYSVPQWKSQLIYKYSSHTKYVLWSQWHQIINHNRKTYGKFSSIWILNTHLKNPWDKEEIPSVLNWMKM